MEIDRKNIETENNNLIFAYQIVILILLSSATCRRFSLLVLFYTKKTLINAKTVQHGGELSTEH